MKLKVLVVNTPLDVVASVLLNNGLIDVNCWLFKGQESYFMLDYFRSDTGIPLGANYLGIYQGYWTDEGSRIDWEAILNEGLDNIQYKDYGDGLHTFEIDLVIVENIPDILVYTDLQGKLSAS